MSTATELAVIEPSGYQALVPSDSLREALIENYGSEDAIPEITENDLSTVSTPKPDRDGNVIWRVPGVGADEDTEAIEGILVHVQRKGTLWPTLELSPKGTRPVLTTNDFVIARKVEPDKDFPDLIADKIEACKIDDDEVGPRYDWKKLAG